MDKHYFRYHLFFCINKRDDGSSCCGNFASLDIRDYTRQRIRELGSAIDGNVCVNTAGCMNRCGEGPVMVVYPEGVWYRYETRTDLDEIISSHLCKGQIVDRLRLGSAVDCSEEVLTC